ncbi:DUF4974 domain-containing protein [Bordetella petrii]|nr:DUF4974 domain-containing protein [Bordetella petrii]
MTDSIMPNPFFSDADNDSKSALLTEARAWARKFAVGQPTTQDAQALKQWCAQSAEHARAWREASVEWKALGEVMHTYRARNPAPCMPSHRPARRWFLGAAVGSAATAVAAVAVLRPPLGLWPSWSELGADYRTATGEQRDVQIGTHIRVALNTQTSISVQEQAVRPRIELIAGEAAVVSDGAQALEVLAGAGSVQLARGCVEVRRFAGDQVRLVCVDGQAQLQHAAGALDLQAGQQVSYDAHAVSSVARRADTTTSAWRDGIVDFDNTPLAQAVAEINRYRPGRVMLMSDALAKRRISGRFKVDALDQAVTLIEQLYQAKVRRLGDVVLLS